MERLRGEQVEALVTTIVTIQYPRGGKWPEPEDRVVYRETEDVTRNLNINAIKRIDPDRKYLELHCKEIQ